MHFHYSVLKCLHFQITPFSDDFETFCNCSVFAKKAWHENGSIHYSVSFAFISLVQTCSLYFLGTRLAAIVVAFLDDSVLGIAIETMLVQQRRIKSWV